MEKLIDKISQVLKTIKYPGFSRDIVSFGIIKKIKINDDILFIDISLETNNNANKEIIRNEILQKININFQFKRVEVNFNSTPETEKKENKIKNIIAISSCKGGVGKSTIALNLACELSKKLKVGLLDLDIYGPSLPTLINHTKQPSMNGDILSPIEKYNIKSMSFGYINNENSPTIWRGPMVSRMTQQFFDNVDWGDLDLLLLDLPPGTGDIQLTLVQKIALTGAIIITTPQSLSHIDVKKGADMFQKVNAPIFGVIENMSGLTLYGNMINYSNDTRLEILDKNIKINNDGSFSFNSQIFKGDAGEKESNRLDLPLLGKINLDPKLSESCDLGVPFITANEESETFNEFESISNKIYNLIKI